MGRQVEGVTLSFRMQNALKNAAGSMPPDILRAAEARLKRTVKFCVDGVRQSNLTEPALANESKWLHLIQQGMEQNLAHPLGVHTANADFFGGLATGLLDCDLRCLVFIECGPKVGLNLSIIALAQKEGGRHALIGAYSTQDRWQTLTLWETNPSAPGKPIRELQYGSWGAVLDAVGYDRKTTSVIQLIDAEDFLAELEKKRRDPNYVLNVPFFYMNVDTR